MQTDPQLGLRVVDLDLDWTGVECNRPQWTALEWRARREVRTQTQWLGNGRRKECSPVGAAANILTLACASVVMGWCCALLARSHIARLLRDHVAKGPGGSAYGPPAASDTSP